MSIIPIISIALEAVIAIVALYSAMRGRSYMAGLAITFAIYVYYDLARHYAWATAEQTLQLMFFVATVAALWSVMSIVRKK